MSGDMKCIVDRPILRKVLVVHTSSAPYLGEQIEKVVAAEVLRIDLYRLNPKAWDSIALPLVTKR
jgi:hypothetical protein